MEKLIKLFKLICITDITGIKQEYFKLIITAGIGFCLYTSVSKRIFYTVAAIYKDFSMQL